MARKWVGYSQRSFSKASLRRVPCSSDSTVRVWVCPVVGCVNGNFFPRGSWPEAEPRKGGGLLLHGKGKAFDGRAAAVSPGESHSGNRPACGRIQPIMLQGLLPLRIIFHPFRQAGIIAEGTAMVRRHGPPI